MLAEIGRIPLQKQNMMYKEILETMRVKYIVSEFIFWCLMLMLTSISVYLVIFGDAEYLQKLFYKSTELGLVLLSISTGAATTRIFTYFSSDNSLKKQNYIRFRLLSNLYMCMDRLQNNVSTNKWEKTKELCAESINDFYLNACEESVEEYDAFITDFSDKFLDIKYEKSICHIPSLINDIEVRIKKMDNKSIYLNRLKRIKKLK